MPSRQEASPDFAVVVRGYDRAQVTEYVARLTGYLEDAHQRAVAAERLLAEQASGAGPEAPTYRDLGSHVASIVQHAEREAAAALREATDQARALSEAAASRAATLTTEAEERATTMIAEAEKRASEMIAEAEKRAGDLTAAAQAEAQQILSSAETEAAGRLSESAARLDEQERRRTNLQAEVGTMLQRAQEHADSRAAQILADAAQEAADLRSAAARDAENARGEAHRQRATLAGEVERLEARHAAALAALSRIASGLTDLTRPVVDLTGVPARTK